VILEPGIYLNLFPVDIQEESMELVERLRSEVPDFRLLREEIEKNEWQVWVYAPQRSDVAYGYGPDKNKLTSLKFHYVSRKPSELPHLICKVIADGLVEHLRGIGYEVYHPKRPPKVRLQVIDKVPQTVCSGMIHLYQGFDLRPFFWADPATGKTLFGVVVDIFWKFRDVNDNSINMKEIRRRYGAHSLIEIAQAQGEYLPGTRSVNYYIARQHIQNRILAFVEKVGEFALPIGVKVHLTAQPVSVLLGGEENA